jgi:G3E family GTPase
LTLRTPVSVVGGYLGAGKTTLVNHLLRTTQGVRLAILVNDFGSLPIDADLIEARSDDLISIAGGCVCCSFGSDLMGALMTLAERRPPPDHVLIETSGVALPGSVARSVALIAAYSMDGVVVLADAETVQARAADRYMGDTIARQLAEADIVVLNKIDLVSATALDDLRGWLGSEAPRARLVEAERGRVPAEVVFGGGRSAGEGPGVFSSNTLRPIGDAASQYESFSLPVTARVDVEKLARGLADASCGLVRAKGLLRDNDGALKALHVVGGRFEVTPVPAATATGIACIGLRGRLERAAVEQAIRRSNTANF